MNDSHKSLGFNSQEISTILAALQFYVMNDQGDPSLRTDAIHDIAVDNEDETSLDNEEVSALSEKIKSLAC